VGLLVAKGFSKWTVSTGLGLRRSSGMNFTESNTSYTFGLGRYAQEQRISTTELNTLIIPIKLGYRIGGLSEVFVAFNPQFVLNAKQEVVQVSDLSARPEVIETGYFTDLKDHPFDYYLQLGYAHSLNEFLKIELGASYNPQRWRISEKQPVGGFLRFNYIIR
jgi:hypothetical protein